MSTIWERLRNAGSFVRWIVQPDDLANAPLKNAPGPLPPARIEPPKRPRPSYTKLPFIGWLLASEDLPEATDLPPSPSKTSFLSALFVAETLPPPPESRNGHRGEAPLSKLFSRDRLPPPPETKTGPRAGALLSSLFSRDRLPPPPEATRPSTDSALNQSKPEIEGDRHGSR